MNAPRRINEACVLLLEGASIAQSTLHPVPAYGHFLTPVAIRQNRERLERWLATVLRFLAKEAEVQG